jgi:hypothetical protein
VVLTDIGNVRWTNATLPGVRQAAEVLGYHGPAKMAFLRLTEVVISKGFPQVKLGAIHGGLNIATPEQELALQEILPIR